MRTRCHAHGFVHEFEGSANERKAILGQQVNAAVKPGNLCAEALSSVASFVLFQAAKLTDFTVPCIVIVTAHCFRNASQQWNWFPHESCKLGDGARNFSRLQAGYGRPRDSVCFEE